MPRTPANASAIYQMYTSKVITKDKARDDMIIHVPEGWRWFVGPQDGCEIICGASRRGKGSKGTWKYRCAYNPGNHMEKC